MLEQDKSADFYEEDSGCFSTFIHYNRILHHEIQKHEKF